MPLETGSGTSICNWIGSVSNTDSVLWNQNKGFSYKLIVDRIQIDFHFENRLINRIRVVTKEQTYKIRIIILLIKFADIPFLCVQFVKSHS